MARFALAEHVFVCLNGEHVVLLDLKADRYWALEAGQTVGLDALVDGWPVAGSHEAQDMDPASPQANQALETLKERGLLTDGIPPGKTATPVTAISPQRELVSETETSAGARSGSWLQFFTASAFAKLALRTWPFERVIQRVKRRKELEGPTASPLDAERARKLVEAFARYRVFLFSSKDECLYDSLALIEFLARYGIYPDWVFGVQTRPFAAHCWVQHGEIVFNDTVEHVSGYTPIMVV
ncbi:MAG: lasso peptide biosynthesis B2 protein [Steroidobacteraceae bacterium]